MRSRSVPEGIASRLLRELEEEKTWKAKFEATTDEQWDRMAKMVRQEITAGDITPLDDVSFRDFYSLLLLAEHQIQC